VLLSFLSIKGGLNSSQTQDLHELNLEELGLDYVDHLMIHYPSDWEQKTTGAKQRQDEWLALEAIYKTGEARTIGISHYCSRHILDVLWVATITPAINQVEYHIGSQDIDSVIETCSDFGITFMSFSPLCGPCTYDAKDSLVNGDLVTEIAKQYEHNTTRSSSRTSRTYIEDFDDTVTGSQVSLAYIVQQGIPVIPKSNTMAHIISNKEIFDFVLSDEHMERLKRTTKPSAEPGDCDVVAANDVEIE
jgi:diketogulonate reductase-like aldo/keto reductase